MFEVDFSHTGAPMAVYTAILVVCILQIALWKITRIPHSVLLLLVGIVLGTVLYFIFPDKEFYLHPDFFFPILLPPIVLEAVFFMKNKDFIWNLDSILTFAIIGTIANTAAISAAIYILRGFTSVPDIPFLHCVVFGTLISAVDPVAVLAVFEKLNVNERLHMNVFGESLLNDAVTIALYYTVTKMCSVGLSALPGVAKNVEKVVIQFGYVSVGGIIVGLIGGLLVVLFMKWSANVQHVQPILFFSFPILVFLLAETFHFSGILAIAVVGLVVKKFIKDNMSEEMVFVVSYKYKMASTYAEWTIFVFLGMSVISKNHVVDWPFITVTIAGSLLFRFVSVIMLTFVLNMFRRKENRIPENDQLIIWCSGIRGAVSYGLVMCVNDKIVPEKNLFVTTTLAVILFTNIVQASTISHLVKGLKVKRSETFGLQEEMRNSSEENNVPSEISVHGERMPISRSELFAAGFNPNQLSRPMLPKLTVSVAQQTTVPPSLIHQVNLTADTSTDQPHREDDKCPNTHATCHLTNSDEQHEMSQNIRIFSASLIDTERVTSPVRAASTQQDSIKQTGTLTESASCSQNWTGPRTSSAPSETYGRAEYTINPDLVGLANDATYAEETQVPDKATSTLQLHQS